MDTHTTEAVESGYGYNCPPVSIAKQVAWLNNFYFPGIGDVHPRFRMYEEKRGTSPLLHGAETELVVPRWQKLGQSYTQALERVFAELTKARGGKFVNHRHGQITKKRLRPHDLSQTRHNTPRLQRIQSEPDEGNLMVIPVQLGMRHRGRSIRRACEVMRGHESEFPLDLFSCAIALLTHPERLSSKEDLYLDAAGDCFDDTGDKTYDKVMSFRIRPDGYLELDSDWTDYVFQRGGAASGFAI